MCDLRLGSFSFSVHPSICLSVYLFVLHAPPRPGTFRWRDRPFSGALPWRLHPGSVSLLLRWSGTHPFASTPCQLLWLRILEFSDAEQSCFVGQTPLSFGVLLFLSVTEFDLPIPCREFLHPCPWEIFICPFWFLFFFWFRYWSNCSLTKCLGKCSLSALWKRWRRIDIFLL